MDRKTITEIKSWAFMLFVPWLLLLGSILEPKPFMELPLSYWVLMMLPMLIAGTIDGLFYSCNTNSEDTKGKKEEKGR